MNGPARRRPATALLEERIALKVLETKNDCCTLYSAVQKGRGSSSLNPFGRRRSLWPFSSTDRSSRSSHGPRSSSPPALRSRKLPERLKPTSVGLGFLGVRVKDGPEEREARRRRRLEAPAVRDGAAAVVGSARRSVLQRSAAKKCSRCSRCAARGGILPPSRSTSEGSSSANVRIRGPAAAEDCLAVL